MHRTFLVAALLSPAFFAAACGGTTVGNVAGSSDAGPDSVGTVVPPGPPPNGEVPEKHHPALSSCSHDRAPIRTSADAGPPDPFLDSGRPGDCVIDADCTAGQNGRCTPLGGWGARQCTYDECFVDGDCGARGVCECGVLNAGTRTQANRCSRNGDCTIDADCGPGGYCSPNVQSDNQSCGGPAPAGYFCHTAKDECVNDKDCFGKKGGNACVFAPERGIWACGAIAICAG